jgi:hypothetical protein
VAKTLFHFFRPSQFLCAVVLHLQHAALMASFLASFWAFGVGLGC